MSNNVLYELVLEDKHIDLIKQSLSLQISNLYEAIDVDIINTEQAIEDIRVLCDMLAVIRGREIKPTSSSVGLMWYKEIDIDEMYELQEPFDQHNDAHDRTVSELLHKAWDNVKDKHWDTIKRMGDK